LACRHLERPRVVSGVAVGHRHRHVLRHARRVVCAGKQGHHAPHGSYAVVARAACAVARRSRVTGWRLRERHHQQRYREQDERDDGPKTETFHSSPFVDWSLIRAPRSTSFGHTNIAIVGTFVRSAETCRASPAELLEHRRMVAACQSLLNERMLGGPGSLFKVSSVGSGRPFPGSLKPGQVQVVNPRRSVSAFDAALGNPACFATMEQALPATSHVSRIERFRFAGKSPSSIAVRWVGAPL